MKKIFLTCVVCTTLIVGVAYGAPGRGFSSQGDATLYSPSGNKTPQPYNVINHLNTGVSYGTHLGPAPAYSPAIAQSVPGLAQQPVTVINTYPSWAGGSAFGTNLLFYGLGSMHSRGSSNVPHVYHDSNPNPARTGGRSFVETEPTPPSTVVPLAPFPAAEPTITSTTFEPFQSTSPRSIYTGNRPPVHVNPESPQSTETPFQSSSPNVFYSSFQTTESPGLQMSTRTNKLAGKPDLSVIPIFDPSRHISTSMAFGTTTETPDLVMNTTMPSVNAYFSEKFVKILYDLYLTQFLRNQTKVDLMNVEPGMEAKSSDFIP